jgi:hypothetical protein
MIVALEVSRIEDLGFRLHPIMDGIMAQAVEDIWLS